MSINDFKYRDGLWAYSARLPNTKRVTLTYAGNAWHGVQARCLPHAAGPAPRQCGFADFQQFAEWFVRQPAYSFPGGADLDKDLLYQGNTLYSPETCLLLPPEINGFVVYKPPGQKGLPPGVSKRPGRSYESRICEFRERRLVGKFKSAEAAHAAYREAKMQRAAQLVAKYAEYLPAAAIEALLNYHTRV